MNLDALIAAGVGPTQAREFLKPLNAAFDRWQINTVERQAAFLGQMNHESTRFTRLEENLYYTTADNLYKTFPSKFRSQAQAAEYTRNPRKLACYVYAGVNGNGDERSCDGWLYRGRSPIQLTGLGNYQKAEDGTGYPLVAQPSMASRTDAGSMIAAWYWASNGCNELADQGLIDSITRRINGRAMHGAMERRELTRLALMALK